MVAETVGAALLVVVYNETVLNSMPDLTTEKNQSSITIPVIFIGNESGRELKVRKRRRLCVWGVCWGRTVSECIYDW